MKLECKIKEVTKNLATKGDITTALGLGEKTQRIE